MAQTDMATLWLTRPSGADLVKIFCVTVPLIPLIFQEKHFLNIVFQPFSTPGWINDPHMFHPPTPHTLFPVNRKTGRAFTSTTSSTNTHCLKVTKYCWLLIKESTTYFTHCPELLTHTLPLPHIDLALKTIVHCCFKVNVGAWYNMTYFELAQSHTFFLYHMLKDI